MISISVEKYYVLGIPNANNGTIQNFLNLMLVKFQTKKKVPLSQDHCLGKDSLSERWPFKRVILNAVINNFVF